MMTTQENEKYPNDEMTSSNYSQFIEKGNGNKGSSFFIRVSEKDKGIRIDQFLSKTLLNLSRCQAKNLIERGIILLNHKITKPATRLKSGDLISGSIPRPQPLYLKPEPIPLKVIYQDSSIIVIDKPPKMVVHPAPKNPSGTLVNAILFHCKDLTGINGILRPGIVHRLDKDTSGVMVVAKNDEAYKALVLQFKNRIVEKVYLAIVFGKFGKMEGIIDSDIGRHPIERKRMSTRTKKGRVALTAWKVLEELGDFTLLEIHPKTGRTHQIRVHLSSIGHPLLGDPLYGRKKNSLITDDPILKSLIAKMGRQALHSLSLEFNHPQTGERIKFSSQIPQEMNEVLEYLRSKR